MINWKRHIITKTVDYNRHSVGKLDHEHTRHHLSPWLCPGDPLRSAGRPLLSPWKRVHHPPSVSLHNHSRGCVRYRMKPLHGDVHTHMQHSLIVPYPLTNPSHSRAVPQSSSIQPHCTAVRACSLSLCSSGRLASYCLIYLWLSVIGQWESILSLWIAPSLPYSPCYLFLATYFSFFPATSFCESHALIYSLISSLLFLSH